MDRHILAELASSAYQVITRSHNRYGIDRRRGSGVGCLVVFAKRKLRVERAEEHRGALSQIGIIWFSDRSFCHSGLWGGMLGRSLFDDCDGLG